MPLNKETEPNQDSHYPPGQKNTRMSQNLCDICACLLYHGTEAVQDI